MCAYLMLYNTHTNDCTTTNPENQMTKCADDTFIVGRMNSNNDLLQYFNHEISHFVERCEQNYLEINENKTKELTVDCRQKERPIPAFTINGQFWQS